MKLIKPSPVLPGGNKKPPSAGKPAWLKEWAENKGRYVFLSCGHIVDLHDKTIPTITIAGSMGIICDIHDSWQKITGPARFSEIAGFTANPDTGDVPPF